MGQRGDIEMQLWAYIDGTCDDAERQRISERLATDAHWQHKYTELLAFHEECLSGIEPEQPSLRFTKNVMEAVTATQVAPATNKYINHTLLRGIAAFFVISIVATVGYALLSIDWSVNSTMVLPKVNFNNWHTERIFNSNFLYAVIGVNVVIGLVLADLLLRRKLKALH